LQGDGEIHKTRKAIKSRGNEVDFDELADEFASVDAIEEEGTSRGTVVIGPQAECSRGDITLLD
jgi:hypothetical protein